MWSRIVEAMLGIWLAISPFVFGYGDDQVWLWVLDYGCAIAVLVLALASLDRRFDKLHLGILGVSLLLAAHTFLAAPSVPPPPAYQNHLVTAFLLAMLAVLPTRSQEPPADWLEFYARRGRRADPYEVPGQRSEER